MVVQQRYSDVEGSRGDRRAAAMQFVRGFLDALERFDAEAVGAALADDVVHVEHPNALFPSGVTRDKQAMLRGVESGRKTLSSQRYAVTHLVVDGDTIAYECTWEGTLAVPLGAKAAGDTLKARFAVFLRMHEDKIKTWTNYDCFEAF